MSMSTPYWSSEAQYLMTLDIQFDRVDDLGCARVQPEPPDDESYRVRHAASGGETVSRYARNL